MRRRRLPGLVACATLLAGCSLLVDLDRFDRGGGVDGAIADGAPPRDGPEAGREGGLVATDASVTEAGPDATADAAKDAGGTCTAHVADPGDEDLLVGCNTGHLMAAGGPSFQQWTWRENRTGSLVFSGTNAQIDDGTQQYDPGPQVYAIPPDTPFVVHLAKPGVADYTLTVE